MSKATKNTGKPEPEAVEAEGRGPTITGNGTAYADGGAVAIVNANCAHCPMTATIAQLTATIERLTATIEQLTKSRGRRNG